MKVRREGGRVEWGGRGRVEWGGREGGRWGRKGPNILGNSDYMYCLHINSQGTQSANPHNPPSLTGHPEC